MSSVEKNSAFDPTLYVIYQNTAEQQVFNLAEAGIPEIPALSVAKHQHGCEPMEMHCHSGCLEVGICLRGALTLCNLISRECNYGIK